jgi:hypothetical protein
MGERRVSYFRIPEKEYKKYFFLGGGWGLDRYWDPWFRIEWIPPYLVTDGTVEWGNFDHIWHLKMKYKKVSKDFYIFL